jgi:CubicO group peptidase (beta-lactamase class C family)
MPPAADDLLSVPEHASIANWRTAPFSRWAFHNVRDIIASADIENVPNIPLVLSQALLPLGDFRLRMPGGASLDLKDFTRATATDALVILRDGRIAYEFYDNGTTAETPHILMSATKSVVGLIVGILHRNGDIDVDALVSNHVPEVGNTAYQGATIRHLLDMQVGVVLDDSQQRAYAAASGWEPTGPGEAPADLHSFFENLAAPHAGHGGPFSYVSANTDLLGWAIERATGQTFAALTSALLWKPMGADHAAYVTTDGKGAPRCTGGLCATARDLARIGQLLVNDGRRGAVEIVPTAWIDDIASNGDRDAWKHGGFAESFAGMDMSYRSGWYVINDEPKTLFAMGIHGQHLFVDRTNRLVIAKFSSQDLPIDYQASRLTRDAVTEIRRCLLADAQ